MNIPNVPTDNLYKFLAIFGLVLFIFSAYMLNEIPQNLSYEIDLMRIKKEALKNYDLKKETKTIVKSYEQKIDSIEYFVKTETLNRKLERFPKLYFSFFILLIASIFLTTFGFVKWYFKTQKFNDKLLVNETEKTLETQKIQVHKLQFEKEFDIYQGLWPKLLKLRSTTLSLRPIVESVDGSETETERNDKKIQRFTESFNECLEFYDNNKPFYPEEIYKIIDSVVKISRREAIEFLRMPKSHKEYWRNAEKNMNEIVANIDEICLKIRDRIGIIEINN